MLRINDEAPNFTAETSQGTINFHEWIGNGWAILFSYPKVISAVDIFGVDFGFGVIQRKSH
jgi:thioredoxin-dependent peroxiredoxin